MNNVNLLQLHNDFVREKRLAKKSEFTLKSYMTNFNVFYNFLEFKKLEEINKSMLLSFFEYLDTRKRVIGKNEEVCGVSANTIRTYRNRLSPFFDWLKQNNFIKQNPFDDIELPRVEENDKKKMLHRDEIERIFTALNFNMKWRNNFLKKRNLSIISTLFYTGIRKGELLGLKLENIDLENKKITISASSSKTRKSRDIPMNDRLFLILEDYLNIRKNYNSPYLFISEQGRQFKGNGLRKLIEKIEKVTKFKFSARQFRHSFAVNILNKIDNIHTVQNLMGHQRISTTAIYLSYIPEEKKIEAVNALNFNDIL